MPSKSSPWTKICLNKDGIKHFDDKSNAASVKDFFCDLANNLVSKLPSPSKKFCESSLNLYYKKYKVKNGSKFNFSYVSSETIQKLLDKIDTDKAAGIDNISGKFLRDGASLLAKPISQLCNISIKYSTFPTACKIANLSYYTKKDLKLNPKTIAQFLYFL